MGFGRKCKKLFSYFIIDWDYEVILIIIRRMSMAMLIMKKFI